MSKFFLEHYYEYPETIKAHQPSQTYSSLEEMHRWALFNLGNTKSGEDGRTYVYIYKEGRYVSRFVSQYSKIIVDNIEPQIRLPFKNRNLLQSFVTRKSLGFI